MPRGERSRLRGAGLTSAAAALLLAGCNLAPHYTPPQLTAPPAPVYKQSGLWAPAVPADEAVRGDWWTAFNDPTLNTLEQEVATANPTLAAAVASYDQSRAYAAEAAAGLLPSLGLGASVTANRQSNNRPLRGLHEPDLYPADTLAGSANYEFDFWGRVRNLVAEGRAEAQASAADLATAKLSLQAQLADDYIALRGLDAQAALLVDTVAAYQKALDLTQARHRGGVASGLDVSRAATQLASAKTQISDVAAARALYENAIASLVGQAAPGFQLAASNAPRVIPAVPTGLPSTLVERRPDVAAAERRAFAANRGIGVARAAFFPDFTLDALLGFQNTGIPGLISVPNSIWSIGTTVAEPIFEGGRRHAALAASKAAFVQASAYYRATVLAAFEQVQDGISQAADFATESRDSADAVTASQATTRLSLIRYRQGATNYLDVVIAQTAELQAEQQDIALQTRRQANAVQLVRALGGGWSVTDLPTSHQASQLARAGAGGT
ncbi:MAG TPA: efflux transporter outer membrane subunit [Caulobacteraceae bacterium]|jgi:NodT family efflux transporter outer membrane factor (OMF) lipoprotein|nr:efflux transporter outer membrane subunit [Caulobacteraceae bacterium]